MCVWLRNKKCWFALGVKAGGTCSATGSLSAGRVWSDAKWLSIPPD